MVKLSIMLLWVKGDITMADNKMRKYRCKICGYEFEHEGPLPEDYVCPLCGASAEEFEEVEE